MPVFFKPQSNLYFRLFLLIAAGSVVALGTFAEVWKWASWETEVGVAQMQPVPFSHKHHVGQLGIDCRYCHTSVETSASAGMPAMHTCMTCHSQIWNRAPMLDPVRQSVATGKSVEWNRVYRIPKYVYFNHSIHIHKGIGCVTCHGKVDEMPLTMKVRTFYMRDCLSCHRDPAKFMRPQNEIFNLHWEPPAESPRLWIQDYAIQQRRLTDCTTCHR